MKRTFRIGSAAGIPLLLHWTFLLIPVWILLSSALTGRPLSAAIANLVLVAVIFTCVVLHELGHALAAARFGVQTKDIILMPIGGVARLERLPKQPVEELIVAVAGPAVNVVIAAALVLTTLPFTGFDGLLHPTSLTADFLSKAVAVNIAMILFNMLPAFPMDGGRILRALLANYLGHLNATRIAAGIGQTMAVLFGLTGLLVLNNPLLLFVAGFVYLGAAQEADAAEMESSFNDVTAGEAMVTRFDAIPAQASAEWALRYAMSANRTEFPVTSSGNYLGMLTLDEIANAFAGGSGRTATGLLCQSAVEPVREGESLMTAIEKLQRSDFTTLPVVNNSGHLEGLITRDSIMITRRFGPLLRTVASSPLKDRPDELRQHLMKMQIG